MPNRGRSTVHGRRRDPPARPRPSLLSASTRPVVIGAGRTRRDRARTSTAPARPAGLRREEWVGRRVLGHGRDTTGSSSVIREALAGRPHHRLDPDERPDLAGRGRGRSPPSTASRVPPSACSPSPTPVWCTASSARPPRSTSSSRRSSSCPRTSSRSPTSTGGVTYVNRAGRSTGRPRRTTTRCSAGPPRTTSPSSGRAQSQEIEDAGAHPRLLGGRDRSCATSGPARRSRSPSNSFLVTRSSDGTPLALATVQRDLRARIRQPRRRAGRAPGAAGDRRAGPTGAHPAARRS